MMPDVDETKISYEGLPESIPTTPLKPGYKATEFYLPLLPWVGFFGILVLIGLGAVDFQDVIEVLLGLAVSGGYGAGKYAESRGMVKAGRE